jgi:hypothetical protein
VCSRRSSAESARPASHRARPCGYYDCRFDPAGPQAITIAARGLLRRSWPRSWPPCGGESPARCERRGPRSAT